METSVAVVLAVLQQDRLSVPVPFQYPHQFRAAVAAKTDDSDLWSHDGCLFVTTNKYTTERPA
jgi:hypothetical protein